MKFYSFTLVLVLLICSCSSEVLEISEEAFAAVEVPTKKSSKKKVKKLLEKSYKTLKKKLLTSSDSEEEEVLSSDEKILHNILDGSYVLDDFKIEYPGNYGSNYMTFRSEEFSKRSEFSEKKKKVDYINKLMNSIHNLAVTFDKNTLTFKALISGSESSIREHSVDFMTASATSFYVDEIHKSYDYSKIQELIDNNYVPTSESNFEEAVRMFLSPMEFELDSIQDFNEKLKLRTEIFMENNLSVKVQYSLKRIS